MHKHTHTHTFKQTCKSVYPCPAREMSSTRQKEAKDVSSQVLFFFFFFVSGWNVRGKLREWVSTEQHGPVKQKVGEKSCGDVCVCIPVEKLFLKGHTSDFCGLTNLLLPKKKRKKKKIGPAWGEREGSALGSNP